MARDHPDAKEGENLWQGVHVCPQWQAFISPGSLEDWHLSPIDSWSN
jgi:hypothetical protein